MNVILRSCCNKPFKCVLYSDGSLTLDCIAGEKCLGTQATPVIHLSTNICMYVKCDWLLETVTCSCMCVKGAHLHLKPLCAVLCFNAVTRAGG